MASATLSATSLLASLTVETVTLASIHGTDAIPPPEAFPALKCSRMGSATKLAIMATASLMAMIVEAQTLLLADVSIPSTARTTTTMVNATKVATMLLAALTVETVLKRQSMKGRLTEASTLSLP